MLLDPLGNQVCDHNYEFGLISDSFLDDFSEEFADEVDVFPGSFGGLVGDELSDVERRLGFI